MKDSIGPNNISKYNDLQKNLKLQEQERILTIMEKVKNPCPELVPIYSDKLKNNNTKPNVTKKKRTNVVTKKKFYQPNFNPAGCNYFNVLMKALDIHIQHALNGGEYHVNRWLDGYDEINNIAYEWDEKHHFDNFGDLCNDDIDRQKQIQESLHCDFIRIEEETGIIKFFKYKS